MRSAYVYTVAADGGAPGRPPAQRDGVRFVAFREGAAAPAPGWQVRRLPSPGRPSGSALFHRIQAHRNFPRAECSLWIDGATVLDPSLDVEHLLRRFLATGADLLAFPHPHPDRREAGEETADPAVLFRRHGNPVRRMEEEWWRGVAEKSAPVSSAFTRAVRASGAVLRYLPLSGRRFFPRARLVPSEDFLHA